MEVPKHILIDINRRLFPFYFKKARFRIIFTTGSQPYTHTHAQESTKCSSSRLAVIFFSFCLIFKFSAASMHLS